MVFIISSCGDSNHSKEEESKNNIGNGAAKLVSPGERQYNINILWDLSDRIDTVKNPSSPQHHQRDIEVIKNIVSIFKSDIQKKGAYKAKSKFRIFFNPEPGNPSINNIARSLVYDLSSYSGSGSNKKKKEAYDSIENVVSKNTYEIYRLIVEENVGKNQWEGSDIWSFFKNDVKDFCIDPNPDYRNILLILTDGYVYHKDSKSKQGNRTSYLLPEVIKVFRNNNKWKEAFDKGDYGLISTRKDLQDLEILVLEISPTKGNKGDEDILKAYLAKWFEEMGVQKGNYDIYNSQLPVHIKNKIEAFFNN